MFRLFRHQVGASGACAAEPEMRCGNLDSETGKHEGTGALTKKKTPKDHWETKRAKGKKNPNIQQSQNQFIQNYIYPKLKNSYNEMK